MDKEKFPHYLEERYDKEIAWYDEKASLNRLIYTLMQWILIVLAAITPILIQLDPELLFGMMLPTSLATFTSMIVAILTAGLKTFKYQENWLNYRTTCETLRRERHLYEFKLGDYENAKSREATFVNRVESMIARENTTWFGLHQKQAKEEDDEATG